MIDGDLKLCETLINGHRGLTEERRRLWLDIAAKYRGNRQKTGDEDRNLSDPVENGSLFGIVDTKVAATTPQRPRGCFTPSRKVDPYLTYAANRDALINHTLRERAYHMTLKKLNAMARVCPHVFVKAGWDWRDRMPRFDVLTPLVCWFDEAADDPLDVSYFIHQKFLRKHEVIDLVRNGLYPKGYVEECRASIRPAESRLLEKYGPDQIQPVYVVYEIHDIHGGAVYHYSLDWQREFLLVQETPEHLFLPKPFFCVSFNEYMDGQRGLSDGEVLRNPAERLSRLDAIEYGHAGAFIPRVFLNPEAFVDPTKVVEQLTRPTQPGQMFKFSLKNGYTWEQAVSASPTPNLPMAFSTARNAAAEDLAYRAGLPAYTRGQEGSKVATELALQQQSEATRRAWDVAIMQDAVTFAAKAGIALYEEHLDEHEVVAAADDDGSGRVTDVQEVFRATLGFRDPSEHAYQQATGQTHASAVDYYYTPEPYEDPLAGNPQSELATLQALYSLSTAVNPMSPINGRDIADRIRRKLKYGPDFLVPEQAQQPAPGAMPPGAPPGAATPAPPPPGGTDPVTAGGAPVGVTGIPTPALGPMKGGAGHPAPVPKGAGVTL